MLYLMAFFFGCCLAFVTVVAVIILGIWLIVRALT